MARPARIGREQPHDDDQDGRLAPSRPGPARLLLARLPWIGILLATSGFQFGRGAPVDGAVFLAAALALTADGLGWLRAADRVTARFSPPSWLALAGGILIAVGVAVLPQFSAPVGVVVSAAGAGAVVLGWPDGNGRRTGGLAIRRAAVLWGAAIVALCIWELTNFFLSRPSGSTWEHPALSDLLAPFWTNPVLRGLAVLAWLAGGYALVRRGRDRR